MGGFERCICCRLCDFLCPSLALELKSGVSFFCFRFALVFFISYRRCIYCGYCSLICPTDCILLSFFVFFLSHTRSAHNKPKLQLTKHKKQKRTKKQKILTQKTKKTT